MSKNSGSTLKAAQQPAAVLGVQAATECLRAHVCDALAAAAGGTPENLVELDASADRLERAARDLSVTLRELAEVTLAEAQNVATRGIARRHFGAWDSGDERSADSERIDADLARKYGGR